MPATFTVTSGSERVVHVYPDRSERTSSGSSVPARSRISSRSHGSLSSEESWSEIDELDEDDDIDPSDSASRARQPTTASSRRHTVEARPAPSRHSSSRHSSSRRTERVEREEPPRRRDSDRRPQPTRRESSHRPHRSSSHRGSAHRVSSDESASTVASGDDRHYYGHHRAAYPPQSGWRHVPAQSHGGHSGYPPSMTSGGGPYHDHYAPPPQALVHMQRHDPFGYPQPNPFSAQAAQQPNPFSPISTQESAGYFPEPMGPPPPRQRPQSFAAPSYHGAEMMAPYHPQAYGAYGGMPAYSPYGPPMHAWSPPPPTAVSPPPRDVAESQAMKEMRDLLRSKVEADDSKKAANSDEIQRLRRTIEEHEATRAKLEKAWLAEREADAAARAAEKLRIEEEKRRKEELDAATKKAKADAEEKAKIAAEKAKEEHDKKLAEVEKAKTESEAAKKALEEEIKKSKPTPDSLKAPIKFKDAVGRKFSFPWHICKTWKGMETLIKQAFLHVDTIGDHVHQGHYDLTGPDGEIILPQVWDSMIQPDWEVTMHMWPMEEEKHHPDDLIDPFGQFGFGMHPDDMPHPKKSKSGKDKSGKSKGKKAASPDHIVNVGPMPGPPSGPYGDPFAGAFAGMPHGISIVPEGKSKDKGKSSKSSAPRRGKEISGPLAWLAGGSLGAKPAGGPAKKGDEKLEMGSFAMRDASRVSSGASGTSRSASFSQRRKSMVRSATADSGVVMVVPEKRKSANNGSAARKEQEACVIM